MKIITSTDSLHSNAKNALRYWGILNTREELTLIAANLAKMFPRQVECSIHHNLHLKILTQINGFHQFIF